MHRDIFETEYKSLLLEKDWSLETVDRVSHLLITLIQDKGLEKEFQSFEESLTASEIQNFAKQAGISLLKEASLAPEVPGGIARLYAALFLFPWYGCSKGAQVYLDPDFGLYRDVQSIFVELILLEVLPQAHQTGVMDDVFFLVSACDLHIRTVWVDQPKHQASLRGLIFHFLGQEKEELEELKTALDSTLENADSLTKAQAYWMTLLDRGLYQEALDFALEVHRKVPESSLSEVKQWILCSLSYLPQFHK